MIKELIGQLLADERQDSSSRPTATTNVMMSQSAPEPKDEAPQQEQTPEIPNNPNSDPSGTTQDPEAPEKKDLPVEPPTTPEPVETSPGSLDSPRGAPAAAEEVAPPTPPQDPDQQTQGSRPPVDPQPSVQEVDAPSNTEEPPPPIDEPREREDSVQPLPPPSSGIDPIAMERGVEIQPLLAEFKDFNFSNDEQWDGEPDGEILNDFSSDLGFDAALFERGNDG